MIHLFGGLQVSTPEGSKEQLAPSGQAELLAYLAYFHGQWHRRDALIERFWPDTSPESGRNRFRIALSRLRSRLATETLPSDQVFEEQGDKLRLSVHFATDVEQLTQVLQKAAQASPAEERIGHFEAAAQLYVGSLLTGFDALWIMPERQRLEDAFLRALHLLVRELREQKRFDEAIHYARQALSLDPLREESYRDLIGVYLAVGRPEAARKLFVELERRFQEELGITPSAQTSQLFREPQERPIPPTPAPSYPHLPRTNTHFVGRVQERAQLQEYLARPGALISVVGFGGFGKTRLALEVARDFTSAFPFWVPLADVLASDSLWNALVAALNRQTSLPPAPPSLAAPERVIAILKQQPALLLLDNTEHLSDETLDTVLSTLRARLPALRCLLTSRRRLGISDEHVFALKSLTPQEGTELFVDRASRTRASFALTPRTQPTIEALSQRLEGIPLAIEMAAARVSILTPEQILTRLEKRFALLVNQNKDVPTRHRTLETTLDWSYQLLTAEQQQFLCTLSAFRGGWTLEAAEAVSEDPQALEHTQTLADASLIQAQEVERTDGTLGMRYSFLETIRQFVASRLEPDHQEALTLRLVDWLKNLINEARKKQKSDTRHFLEEELENYTHCLNWAMSSPHHEDHLLFLIAHTGGVWSELGRIGEGAALVCKALACITGSTTLRKEQGTVLTQAAFLARMSGSLFMVEQVHACCERLAPTLSSPLEQGSLSSTRGMLALFAADTARARALFEESYNHFRPVSLMQAFIAMLNWMTACAREHDWAEVARLLPQLEAPSDDPFFRSVTLYFQALVARYSGALEQAQALHDEAAAIFAQTQDMQGIMACRGLQADLWFERGKQQQDPALLQQALQHFQKSGQLAWKSQDASELVNQWVGCLQALIALGAYEEALVLLGGFRKLLEHYNTHRTPDEHRRDQEREAEARAGYTGNADTRLTEGYRLSLEELISRAFPEPPPAS